MRAKPSQHRGDRAAFAGADFGRAYPKLPVEPLPRPYAAANED